MSGRRPLGLSRRAFAALLLRGGGLAAALGRGTALAQDPNAVDRGVGGTGVAPIDPGETLGQDRGIGGTGVIGTIRRFGSIVVNDIRVTFPADVKVSIDGRPAALGELRLGHVVHVLARRRAGELSTRAIVARSEVVGPLDAREGRSLVVLGQRVELDEGVALPAHRPGDILAVSGLRRPDGTVVASLIERRPPGAVRLHGPVEADAEGRPTIGGLRVAGLAASLLGRRVSLVGRRRGGVFQAAVVAVEPRVPFAAADLLSVEAYVARAPEGLRLGSGLDVAAGPSAMEAVGAEGAVRAVVVARPGPAGRLDAQSLRVEHDTRGSGGDGGRGPGRPDGGGHPGDPGHAGPGDPGSPGGGPDGGHGGPGGGPGGPAGNGNGTGGGFGGPGGPRR